MTPSLVVSLYISLYHHYTHTHTQLKHMSLSLWKLKYVCVVLLDPPNVSGSTNAVDEHAVTMGFHQWLASVTERIHLTMHYQNNGTAQFYE